MVEADRLMQGAVMVVVLMVILATIGLVASGLDDTEIETVENPAALETTSTWVEFQATGHADGDVEEINQVRDTTGYALSFDGDGYVTTGEEDIDGLEDNWSVTTAVWIDQDATDGDMVVLATGDPDLIIRYNDSQWHAFVYGITDSYELTLDATDETNRTHVTVQLNESSLALYERTGADTEQSVTTDLDGGSVEGNLSAAEDLSGQLDETRLFDEELNQSQRADLYTDPARGVVGANETARLMYDEGSGSTTAVFFQGIDAEVVNAEWVADGVAPTVLTDGVDYEIDDGEIRALEGGALDNRGVAWVEYEFRAATWVGAILSLASTAVSLFAIGLILIPAVAIALLLRSTLRGQGSARR